MKLRYNTHGDHANSQETVAVSDRNHRNVTMHINSYNRSILLQTATAKVYNTSENAFVDKCRLLFDGGSQRTYISNELREKLKLRTIRGENVIMKRFASDEGVIKNLDVVQFCVRGKSNKLIFIWKLFVCRSYARPSKIRILIMRKKITHF